MGHISILPPSFHIKLKLHGGGWIKFITASIQFGFVKEGHEYNIFNPLKHQIKENQRVTMTNRRTKLLPRINFYHNWSTNRLTNQLDECKIVATAGCTLQVRKSSLRGLQRAGVGRWGSIEPHEFFFSFLDGWFSIPIMQQWNPLLP